MNLNARAKQNRTDDSERTNLGWRLPLSRLPRLQIGQFCALICGRHFEVSCLFSDSSLPPAVRDEFHGRMFSSCFCAPFNRWRKPLMYSSSGSCCCWCISSNARKTSTRCFFSITRSACSNSRTTVRYRTVFKGLQVLYLVKCSPGGWGKVVWPSVSSRH